jgi:hypothetical protein
MTRTSSREIEIADRVQDQEEKGTDLSGKGIIGCNQKADRRYEKEGLYTRCRQPLLK